MARSGLRAPAGAPVRVSTSRSIKRAAAKASISRTRSVSARFSISSTSAILSSVIVVSWFRFKRRNSNPNRRPAVTTPGVRCAQQGFAHALSGSVLHHAQGRHGDRDRVTRDVILTAEVPEVATEGALWGAIRHHGRLNHTVIVSDDAGQFRV